MFCLAELGFQGKQLQEITILPFNYGQFHFPLKKPTLGYMIGHIIFY
jgi:hypothetical protein